MTFKLDLFEKKVLSFLKETLQEKISSPLVLLVSGGKDSMALLHCFAQLKYTSQINSSLYVIHFNHQKRGEESVKDGELVAQEAWKWGLPFFLRTLEKPLEGNFQEQARNWRYEEAQKILEQTGEKGFLLTAHHALDLAESMMMHLLRGCGPEGLVGIKPLEKNLLRPFLYFSQEDILKYIESHQIPYRNDASNFETIYHRNKIRHLIFPHFKEWNPQFEQSFLKLSQSLLTLTEEKNEPLNLKEEHLSLERISSLLKQRTHYSFPITHNILKNIQDHLECWKLNFEKNQILDLGKGWQMILQCGMVDFERYQEGEISLKKED